MILLIVVEDQIARARVSFFCRIFGLISKISLSGNFQDDYHQTMTFIFFLSKFSKPEGSLKKEHMAKQFDYKLYALSCQISSSLFRITK